MKNQRPRRTHKLRYGGNLRNQRAGRGHRPLSTRDPIHVVLKANRRRLRSQSLKTYANFRKITRVLQLYSIHFNVRMEQFAIEGDHIHLLLRAGRRAQFQAFFRVVAGQIAQRLPVVTDTRTRGTKLWKHRPFSNIVVGPTYYRNVRNYIQLNVKESSGEIRYQKKRLRGLSMRDWEILWA